jgi:hypothetical protein
MTREARQANKEILPSEMNEYELKKHQERRREDRIKRRESKAEGKARKRKSREPAGTLDLLKDLFL